MLMLRNAKFLFKKLFILAGQNYGQKYVECKENGCQPNELEDELIETNHTNTVYPKEVPLVSSDTKLKCRKVPLILRYFEPNK